MHSITKAKELRALKLAEVQRAKMLGYVEPTKDSFADYVPRYLKHQETRLTPRAYKRTEGIVEDHLKPVF